MVDPRPGDTATRTPATRASGPGQAAPTPGRLGLRAWWQVLKRVAQRWVNENLDLLAIAIAFRALLTFFPIMVAVVTMVALVADPTTVVDNTSTLLAPLPPSARQLVGHQLAGLANLPEAGLGIGFVIAVVIGVWSLLQGMGALSAAYHVIYAEHDRRPVIRGWSVQLGLGVLMLISGFLAVVLAAVAPVVFDLLPVGGITEASGRIARWIALVLLMLSLQALLSRFAVDRRPPRWRWLEIGSLVGVLLWLLGCVGISIYTRYAGRMAETYGTLTGIVILLLWLQLSVSALLLGALINSESEHQTDRDTTVGPEQPRGERGAVVADHSVHEDEPLPVQGLTPAHDEGDGDDAQPGGT